MLGNGVVGILSESSNKWERRVPLTPSHCARLLHGEKGETGVARIIVKPSTKRIFHDALYEDVGCKISEDLSECGLIMGVKQPKLDMILPDRAYSFFSHTHKAQKENMPLLDKVLEQKVSLFDYELIVGDHGKRLLSFGRFAGRAGIVDFLHGLGLRYLNLGFSTPFLSLAASYMYPSLAAAKAAVITVAEEISTLGLPRGICPLVFVFTGAGNVSQGAQEIFKLLPHTMVDASKLPELYHMFSQTSDRDFFVYGCVVTSEDMVKHIDPAKAFDKADYYAHPENYTPMFHEKVAPYASVIVNCMYWEKRFPRLLSRRQIQDLAINGSHLVGIADITCDFGGSIEFVNETTSLDSPFFRYNPLSDSYHHDLDGPGVICSSVDILPTEFAREASQYFGDILSQFVGSLAREKSIAGLPNHLRRACIAAGGVLTALYDYIPRMRKSDSGKFSDYCDNNNHTSKCSVLISLSGHLFDQFLINEALDIIEAAGGSFHLVRCQVGQSTSEVSYSELEVGADDSLVLNHIIDSLSSIANSSKTHGSCNKDVNGISLKIHKTVMSGCESTCVGKTKNKVLIMGAGRVCRPAAELLATLGGILWRQKLKAFLGSGFEEVDNIHVIVASLYLRDAEEVINEIPNATAVQLDVSDSKSLCKCIAEVELVISLLPPSFHVLIAQACIKLRKHLVTASYIDESMSRLDSDAKHSNIIVLGEMGLDPGIDHMMASKVIYHSHSRGGRIRSFSSYCGGLPSPAAANNPLGYKFSWDPVGALRSGKNPAIYKSCGVTIDVEGDSVYDSAVRFRIPNFLSFALEVLPNRNSLVYGEMYGIENEASTIFRGTLRYEGFGGIMSLLSSMGFFNRNAHPILEKEERPVFKTLLFDLLKIRSDNFDVTTAVIVKRISDMGLCKNRDAAWSTAKLILFLGLHEQIEIPKSCRSAFDVTCQRMEERLSYSSTEQDMVLLHHKVEIDFPDGQASESNQATLLEFGRVENGRSTSAMALTVGVPVAIGALLVLGKKVKRRGVVRPTEPEIFLPALDFLHSYGLNIVEEVEFMS